MVIRLKWLGVEALGSTPQKTWDFSWKFLPPHSLSGPLSPAFCTHFFQQASLALWAAFERDRIQAFGERKSFSFASILFIFHHTVDFLGISN